MTLVYQQWGKPEMALEYFQKALDIDEELKDIRGKATRFNNIGDVYKHSGESDKALEYFQKAHKLFEELKDVRSANVVRKNIESLYSSIKD